VRVGIWWGNLRERDHLEHLGVDGRIMPEWIVKKSVWRIRSGLISLRIDRSGGAVVNIVMKLPFP
jgi:hypothetical protein